METHEFHTVDKSEWSDGPWKTEPDKRQWLDEETDYRCVIERNPVGALCGYVGVAPGHPAYGKPNEVVDVDVRVHGGLTFADKCIGYPGVIGQEIEFGEPDDVYWLGFNCAHMGDRCPKIDMHIMAPRATVRVPSTYRDMSYVIEQCRLLAAQLKAMELQS